LAVRWIKSKRRFQIVGWKFHGSYHKLFAPLPGQADITHCGGHFYESANRQRDRFRMVDNPLGAVA